MRLRSRLLTFILGSQYLLAITASGLLHNHGRVGVGGCGSHAAESPCDSSTCCPQHDLGHHVPETGRPTLVAASGCAEPAQCPVCSFLAQKPIPPQAMAEVARGALQPAHVVWLVSLAAGAVRLPWDSRGPPFVA